MGSKRFWSTAKPFFSSKGFIHNNDISIEIDNKLKMSWNLLKLFIHIILRK